MVDGQHVEAVNEQNEAEDSGQNVVAVNEQNVLVEMSRTCCW